ncbi:hypothetical protein [Lacinutrix jangbogonensis]|uniref:hypothetical protein n=1 Tax=Lacinutrix jangbogonensis TaxID=1469557 RepID=UPI00053DB1F0|nr:hypothetical protein [Lacinutrix jangbogonensis]
MKAAKTYLKGQSVFIISIIVILLTILTVYINGQNHERSITSNFYISLAIIGTVLFLFMTYGLYKGIGLKDNFPNFKSYEVGNHIPSSGEIPAIPIFEGGDGIGGFIMSVLVWIGMTILIFLLLILLEIAFWFTLFIIIMMLYWLFFRALKLVFTKAAITQGDIRISALYGLGYSILYLGWIFIIVFIAQKF